MRRYHVCRLLVRNNDFRVAPSRRKPLRKNLEKQCCIFDEQINAKIKIEKPEQSTIKQIDCFLLRMGTLIVRLKQADKGEIRKVSTMINENDPENDDGVQIPIPLLVPSAYC
ncbi:unnamed protein product [Didymodactylos carnosus]|uniref:Uncharacterized protein n=1 Tax=Didymodactylos carnosus TaxID=1234261 RepID=A0A815U7U2_9BILA|nr:unnamed protein product [Didymodactylos carnosus]CAF1547898.1 unnamed protein product [Didymodactylos carnosus]CAF4337398.1 unnamed protein product [Didymodactylos carnosus]CAF4371119.1 unnamed protein product [Didymodactylos carnosus]